MNPTVSIQILPSQIVVAIKDDLWSGTVVRGENGKLASTCRERIGEELKAFLQRHGIKGVQEAAVALPARGITLRTLEIPRVARGEMEQVLKFQIENEFPVPPEELAWGWQPIDSSGNPQTQKVLVAAAKRDLIREWQDLFVSAGLAPTWTIAPFARMQLVPPGASHYAQLHIEEGFSELVVVEGGSPTMVRSLHWGAEHLEAAIQGRFNLSHSEAAQWLAQWREGSFAQDSQRSELEETLHLEARKLATMISGISRGKTVYLSGALAAAPGFADALRRSSETSVELLPGETVAGRSSATWRGLTAAFPGGGKKTSSILTLGTTERKPEAPSRVVQVAQWKWPAIAAALLVLAFFMRYAEALIHKPRLAKKIEEIKNFKKSMPQLDAEIAFLQFVQTNQTPYLDAIHAIAAAAARGTKVDALSMNRRGDISIKATMQNAQQATELRTKMYDSGLFSAVVLEEQNPSQDGQKMTIRMGAQLKEYQRIKEALAAADARKPASTPTNKPPIKVVKK
ncbi:MAG: pilus assembly protein PilM [Verrucomicrobiales bacterium]